jgi:hypothetical protein
MKFFMQEYIGVVWRQSGELGPGEARWQSIGRPGSDRR